MVSSPKITRLKAGIKIRLNRATSILIPKTENWAELFLKPAEKNAFAQWDEQIIDRSVSTKVTGSFFDNLSFKIPDYIAPNLISLTGLIVLTQCWYCINRYGGHAPQTCTWLAIFSICVFYLTNNLDVRQAISLRQKNGLNLFFKYSIDCMSTVFLTLITSYCLGVTEWRTQWYVVQFGQLTLFCKHLSAFNRVAGMRYGPLSGPGEVLMFVLFLLTARAVLGLEWMINFYELTVHKAVVYLEMSEFSYTVPSKALDLDQLGAEMISTSYYAMYSLALFHVFMLPKVHNWTKFGLSTCLLMRCGPALAMFVGLPYLDHGTSTAHLSVVADGFFMAALISDVTLAKMAGRELHPWVIAMGFCSMMSDTVIYALCATYYIAVFADLCHYMNLPLLTVCINVYCDGVYDLCHIGHKNLFKRALTHGNRLFVGVCNDEACSAYKRPPIMNHEERCNEVAGCKAVTKVIPNAPCDGITQEFLEKHQIHAVCFGQEYLERWPDPKDDLYYSVPRMQGIARPMPRTPGLSTSDLIRRIQESQPADQKLSLT